MTATWGLIIDVGRCHDCNNCFLACKDEFTGNDWPGYSRAQPDQGQRWLNIHRRERGEYPLVAVAYLPKPCQHCQNPPCRAAARDGAVYTRKDGIVLIDPEKAVGQRQLVEACPYDAIFWNEALQSPQKCTLCAHLLDEGWREPRCSQVCPTGAIQTKKLEAGQWQEMIRNHDLQAYRPELQTEPRILYKNLQRFTHEFIAGSVALGDTDECAENAEVCLRDVKGREIATTRTNNYGDFKLLDLEPAMGEAGESLRLEIKMADRPPKVQAIDLKKSLSVGTIYV